ncbi:MAG: cation:dicarboxylate symporter family transporter [Betaproteobacteria bacterium]
MSGATAPSVRRGLLARWQRLGLSARILIGLALGVLTGLFFGEDAALLQPAADIFIRLMQMTVMPYLVLALILGLGQLSVAQARRLASRMGALLLVFCALALAVVALMPLAFPRFVDATFFTHALTEPRQPFAFTDLFFTANPFHALANTVVPAVVLFSAAVGIALIGVQDKESALRLLRVFDAAIARVMSFVIGLTPFGVFAIAGVAAGTMDPELLVRLEVYLLTFGIAAALLAFVILPVCVTAVTPIGYREVVGVARDALLTAFIANSVFIVLPMLVERAKELLQRHRMLTADGAAAAEVVVPILFNFPNAGRLLTLLFVPFAAWLTGAPLPAMEYPGLLAAGLFSYFAKAQVALPFLMDLVAVPHDLFQLYIPTTIITGKFDSLVAAMNLLVFALLGGGAMAGALVFERARLLRAAAVIVVAVIATVAGARLVLATVVDGTYRKDDLVKGMHLPRQVVPTVVHAAPPPAVAGIAETGGLERIRSRGSLRVGFIPDLLPYTFFNARGELVGFDVEMGGRLARDVGAQRLELVPTDWASMPSLLASGAIDVMFSVPYAVYWLRDLRFSLPHTEGVYGFAVLDERRHGFASIDEVRAQRGLTIGIPVALDFMQDRIQHYLGPMQATFVSVSTPREFFEGRRPEIDALLVRAEVGSAWSLLHPQYSIVVPQPVLFRVPTGVATSRAHSADLAAFVDDWLVIERASGSLQRAHEYWVLGRGAEDRRRRWSILHDVLLTGR